MPTGCWERVGTEVTLIQGWNWYAGATDGDPGRQFDFETVVMHELGRVLGWATARPDLADVRDLSGPRRRTGSLP